MSEAFAAVEPLRRLNLAAVRGHTERGLRGIVYVVMLTPILFALAWLLWPAIRGRLGGGKGAVHHG